MSRLLLDSHVLFWYADGDSRLRSRAANSIRTADQVFVSSVSIWELTIKMVSGKLAVRSVKALIEQAGCLPLPVSADHAEAIAGLPQHHRDPFDHLLLAQAKVEGLTLVTHDRVLAEYGVAVLLV